MSYVKYSVIIISLVQALSLNVKAADSVGATTAATVDTKSEKVPDLTVERLIHLTRDIQSGKVSYKDRQHLALLALETPPLFDSKEAAIGHDFSLYFHHTIKDWNPRMRVLKAIREHTNTGRLVPGSGKRGGLTYKEVMEIIPILEMSHRHKTEVGGTSVPKIINELEMLNLFDKFYTCDLQSHL